MLTFLKNGCTFFFILTSTLLFSQTSTHNQFDKNGKRHGKWIKKFEGTDQIRYSGQFDHGKEIGTFKFYTQGNKDYPQAIKKYTSGNDIVEVEFYTEKGKLLTKGQFKDKKRVGEWIYYHKGTKVIMMIENYENDMLNGLRSVFYENGKIAEKQEYLNNVRHGENFVYGANGNLLQYYNYKNGTFHGVSKIYTPQGKLSLEGNYKEGLKDGIWKHYENGKVIKTEKFPKEKPRVRKKK